MTKQYHWFLHDPRIQASLLHICFLLCNSWCQMRFNWRFWIQWIWSNFFCSSVYFFVIYSWMRWGWKTCSKKSMHTPLIKDKQVMLIYWSNLWNYEISFPIKFYGILVIKWYFMQSFFSSLFATQSLEFILMHTCHYSVRSSVLLGKK